MYFKIDEDEKVNQLKEVQRWANIAPQNLLRRMNKEVTIGGVTIPEGASITPQISMLLADETVNQ